MRRFIFVGCVVLAIYAIGLADSALHAQPYPHRPIQLVIPMGPGTGTDLNGRILTEELKKILKTEIFVVNKPGASQTSGTDAVVKSKKDGYTLLYAGGAAIIAKAIEPETVPYDPLRDLEPLRILLTSKKMMEFPNIPVLNELGYKQELPSPWFGMYGPAGIPEEVKKVLVPAIKEAIHHPDVNARINKIGGTVIDYKSPEELKKITAEELEAISAIAIKIGLRK